MNAITGFLITLKEFYPIKLIGGFSVALIFVLLGSDNYLLYEGLFILIMIDLFSGLIKINRNNNKFSLTKFKDTLNKLLLYSLLLIATNQVQKISTMLVWVDDFSLSFLAITELLSIIDNLSKSGILIPEWVEKKLEYYIKTGNFK